MHREGVVQAANEAAHSLFEVPVDEDIRGLSIFAFVHADSQEALTERIRNLEANGGTSPTALARMVRRDGSEFWVESRARLTEWNLGPVVQVLCWDVTERVRNEARLAFAAEHDALTGLPNRLLLEKRWDRAVSDVARLANVPGLIYCDLDDFKSINDRYGHTTGDRILRVAGERLDNLVRPGDTVARLGGDEFVLLLPDVGRRTELLLTRRVRRALGRPVAFGGGSIDLSAAVGSARRVSPDEGLDDVLGRADAAMYRDKDRPRS